MSQWDEIWRNKILAERSNSGPRGYYSKEGRAERYDASELIWTDASRRVRELAPDPSWSILEIGPGPGVMTIPLAKRVKSVTAVEIAEPMIAILKRHLHEEGIDNVRIIHENWEESDPGGIGRHDLVLASYCLDMPEIRSSLAKMCSLATRAVHLWWFEGKTAWEQVRMEVMEENSDPEKSGFPKAEVLMHILAEMGYSPRYEQLVGTSFPKIFRTREEAEDRMADMLRLAPSMPLPPAAMKYIDQNWLRPDGMYEYPDPTVYVHISVPTGG